MTCTCSGIRIIFFNCILIPSWGECCYKCKYLVRSMWIPPTWCCGMRSCARPLMISVNGEKVTKYPAARDDSSSEWCSGMSMVFLERKRLQCAGGLWMVTWKTHSDQTTPIGLSDRWWPCSAMWDSYDPHPKNAAGFSFSSPFGKTPPDHGLFSESQFIIFQSHLNSVTAFGNLSPISKAWYLSILWADRTHLQVFAACQHHVGTLAIRMGPSKAAQVKCEGGCKLFFSTSCHCLMS